MGLNFSLVKPKLCSECFQKYKVFSYKEASYITDKVNDMY